MTGLAKKTSIIIFAKKPQVGKVKTRLIPALGAEQARQLAEIMLRHTIANVLDAIKLEPSLSLNLCVAPDKHDSFWQQFTVHKKVSLSQQVQGNLGERMATETQKVMAKGERAILIGSDCPALSCDVFLKVYKELGSHDAVMHPAADGGYVLLGLSRYSRKLFSEIPWSTDQVAPLTLKALEQLNFCVKVLEEFNDIDDADDLPYLPAYLQHKE